jgi:hypothetical protein
MTRSSPLRPSARDRAVVETVTRFRQLTAGQLRRLFFAEGSPASQPVRQRRVLARLVRDQQLERLPRPIGGGDGGSGGYVYIPPASHARIPNPHTLDIADLYVRLVEADRQQLLALVDLAPEPYCHVATENAILKPDTFLRVRTTTGTFQYFIEIDRGTEWRPQLRAKARAYARAFASWTEPTFPKVVFVVPDQLRCAFIAELVKRQPNPELFSVVVSETVIAHLAAGS